MSAYVMGDDEVVGEEVVGDDVGYARSGRVLRLPPKPGWRQGQVAQGVWGPRQGLEMLPLRPEAAAGIFSPTQTNIVFSARPQRPFRGERLLASVRRTGAGAAGILVLAGGIFIGTAPQLVELGEFDIEFFGSQAFGVRMSMTPADPGILVRIPCFTSTTPGVGEALAVNMILLGHTIG